MAIKRCNHCEQSPGVGQELSIGDSAACPRCGCMWGFDGYHQLNGSVAGKACAYPQPQAWGNSTQVQMQRDDNK